jgi:hypothetical protein
MPSLAGVNHKRAVEAFEKSAITGAQISDFQEPYGLRVLTRLQDRTFITNGYYYSSGGFLNWGTLSFHAARIIS